MEPKTVLVICIVLIAIGSTVGNLLSLAGATKTKVEGGSGTHAVKYPVFQEHFLSICV